MKNKVLPLIFLAVILAAALVTGFVLVWRLFVLFALLLLISYLWSRLSAHGLESRSKQLPEHCQVGETFSQEIILLNRDKMPKLLLAVKEETDLPGYHNVSTVNLPAEGTHRWGSEVRCQRRGEYKLGSLQVTASDPFGLFRRQLSMGEPQKIIVCPATLELPLFEPLSRQGTGYGPERWLASKFGPNVASVREYLPGDSLKRIHWHSTAHSNKLMVKVFDPDRTRKVADKVWVVVDMHQPSHLTKGEDSTVECALTVAASIVKKYVNEAMPIGMAADGDRRYLISPGVGEHHLWHILTTLALMKATGNTAVEQLISEEQSRFGFNSILIVVTPTVSERLSPVLRQIRSHGGVVVAVLVDPATFGATAGSNSTARSLISSGVQVHAVRRGDDLPVVLDSRNSSRIPEVPGVRTDI